MNKEPLYILTYDHGGYVLWEKEVKPRLKSILRWMEKYPKLKIGLDYESFTFDEFMRSDPEVVSLIGELLKKYPDRAGLGATTYGQPLSLYISEESNIRQLSYAVKTNLEYFGVTPRVYCISEFALNNQTPQMIKLCGYNAAILRSHVMGYGYTKTFDVPYGLWEGKDGTKIPAVPTYDGQGRGYNCTTLDNWILSRWPQDTDISLEDFRERFKNFSPLLASRYDDLTQPIEEITAEIEKHDDYKYVLLDDLPELFGETQVILDMTDNDFHSQMPWGYCGNEIFCGIRQGETAAVTAEKLNVLSVLLGGSSFEKESEEAWKYILAAQHHDVTICGLLDLSRRFIPSSLSFSDKVKGEALKVIEKHFSHKDEKSVFVMNPHSFPVDSWVEIPVTEDFAVKDTFSETVTAHNGEKMLRIRVNLPAFCAKSLVLDKKAEAADDSFFCDSEKGFLSTPFYDVQLCPEGIKRIFDKRTSRAVLENECGELLSAFVNGEYRKNESSCRINANKYTCDVLFEGKVGTLPFTFTMTFFSTSPRIDCRLTCTVSEKDRIGRTDITEGRPVPLTVNGHHHDDKLCFVMNMNLKDNREMLRDLPFSIAKWDGQLRLTEEYWYPNDRILVDTPVSAEEAFEGKTHLQGVYWVALRDDESGTAVMNRGCMGSTVEGNRVYIPLIYSNDYMCGTKILDGTFVNEFSLLPFTAKTSAAEIHKAAMEYNYTPVAHILNEGNGKIRDLCMAKLSCDNDAVILTALLLENGKLTARFCNFSDTEADMSFSAAGKELVTEIDLLGNTLCKNKSINRIRPWEIKTLS